MICHYFPEPLYFLFVPDLALIYYAHIPVAILSLVIGFFVYFNGRKFLLNQLLFVVVLCFAFWNLINMIAWTNIHSDFILFTWSFFGPLYSLISVFSIYFIYVFLNKHDVTVPIKLVFVTLLAPVFIIAPTVLSLSGFNISDCDAFGFEGFWYHIYYNFMGVLAMLWILWLLITHYHKAEKVMRRQILLMGIGIEFFLFSFFFAGFLGSYLAGIGVLDNSEIEIYGLFGMAFFMSVIGFMIVNFKTFHVGMVASQALVIALIIIIGSQFTFATSITETVLTALTLVLTAAIGIVLIRSVKREIEQRKHIEELAKELEKSNKQQIILIHFITHQIKGFLTKSRNIFAMMLDGDFGPVPDTMRPMLDEGFKSDTKGVNTIQEILTAANIKSGKVTYEHTAVDLKAVIEEVSKDLKLAAEAKGLTFTLDLDPITIQGDKLQLTNALKNLIDNSIKYTLTGSVKVSLRKEGEKVRFKVEDTGVGITAEDMGKLFTEGGHGTNSQKVNVESTGFGLYIVKNIIEAHHGKVWAESEGEGKGSRFIAELPA